MKTLPVCIDTREQAALTFSANVTTTAATLSVADYTTPGLEDRVALERKSLSDLVACCTRDRPRFVRELERLRGWPCRGVVIEASFEDVRQHRYRSRTAPAAVIASIAAWSARYQIAFWFAGDPAGAAIIVEEILYHYRQDVQALLKRLSESPHPDESGPTVAPRKPPP